MRYIVLVLLNLPIISLAFVNIITQYKLGNILARRFRWQLLSWLTITMVLVLSFPLFNYFSGKELLDSSELSLFDIAEITIIVWLFYMVNHQRQRLAQNEKTLQDLHRELAIKMSVKK